MELHLHSLTRLHDVLLCLALRVTLRLLGALYALARARNALWSRPCLFVCLVLFCFCGGRVGLLNLHGQGSNVPTGSLNVYGGMTVQEWQKTQR